MLIERIEAPPRPELAEALSEFERSFRYPLGPERSFRISHGEDYHAFFRAIGEAACFFAVDGGEVLGALAVVVRRLGLPGGGERRVAYVADLKVAAMARGRGLLSQLAHGAESWTRARTDAAFGVVMDGTPAVPSQYTRRLGLPAFDAIGKLAILRLSTESASNNRLPR